MERKEVHFTANSGVAKLSEEIPVSVVITARMDGVKSEEEPVYVGIKVEADTDDEPEMKDEFLNNLYPSQTLTSTPSMDRCNSMKVTKSENIVPLGRQKPKDTRANACFQTAEDSRDAEDRRYLETVAKPSNYSQMSGKCARRENYSLEEKSMIIEFVAENKTIMEDKSYTARMITARQEKWKLLAEKLTAYGTEREWKDVRSAYQRWKTAAKKNIAAHRKFSSGGSPAVDEPSATDIAIRNICPEDFVEDENNVDSDSTRRRSHQQIGDSTSDGDQQISLCEFRTEDSEPKCSYDATLLKRAPSVETVEPPSKKFKNKMTSYERALLNLHTEKMNQAIAYQAEEHRVKMEILNMELKKARLEFKMLESKSNKR